MIEKVDKDILAKLDAALVQVEGHVDATAVEIVALDHRAVAKAWPQSRREERKRGTCSAAVKTLADDATLQATLAEARQVMALADGYSDTTAWVLDRALADARLVPAYRPPRSVDSVPNAPVKLLTKEEETIGALRDLQNDTRLDRLERRIERENAAQLADRLRRLDLSTEAGQAELQVIRGQLGRLSPEERLTLTALHDGAPIPLDATTGTLRPLDAALARVVIPPKYRQAKDVLDDITQRVVAIEQGKEAIKDGQVLDLPAALKSRQVEHLTTELRAAAAEQKAAPPTAQTIANEYDARRRAREKTLREAAHKRAIELLQAQATEDVNAAAAAARPLP